MKARGIQIRMAGKGCWRDNVLVERVRKSVTNKEASLHAYDCFSNARKGLGTYVYILQPEKTAQDTGR
jgi:putative transposase